jgi:hypothetical protein
MKNFTQHKILGSNGPIILLVLFFLIQIQETQAQHISNNGTYISITNGTVIGMDSITNYNSATLVNNGTFSAHTVNNSGTLANGGSFTATDVNNTLTFGNTGTLTATTVINSGTGTFENLNIFSAPTVNNSGTFTNDGSFTATDVNNTLTFGNRGTLTADSVINSGTFENLNTFSAPTVNNSGTFSNGGSFTATDVNNTLTFGNTGTLNVTTINNEGNTLGDGTYNITGDFTSSGSFLSEAGAVNMNGTSSQIMTMAATTFNNLTINNAGSVTLISTQTVITNNLTINSGKIFKIEADKNLTVTGTINNYGGTSGFVLKSNNLGTASLIHNTIDVPVTVQRYISGVAEDWHFLSAPVSDQSISGGWNPSGTYGNGTGYDLYLFNEPTPCWTYQLNFSVAPTWPSIHPSANFVTGRGYLYSIQATNPTKEFIGLLNNGTISYPITNVSPDPIVKGFNLIGNPYPSSIDWKSGSGWIRTDLVPSGGGYDMWIWSAASNNYGVYNSNGEIGTNGVSQYIAPTQGYFVRAESNGNIRMSNTIRVNNGASNWLQGTNTGINNLKIRIASNDGHGYDEVLLKFGYPENEAGALKLFSQNEAAPSAYFYDLNKDLSVRYLTDTIENSRIPLRFRAGKNGSFSLSVNAEIAAFDVLLLEDKKTNTITDLKANSDYDFNGATGDAVNRFVLHFKAMNITTEDLPVTIYYDGNEINVDLTLVTEQTEIKIYDMLGRLILEKKKEGEMIHRFKINTKNAAYIVVANSNGKSKRRVLLVY